MFGRKKPEPALVEQAPVKPGGKGRPTPSRREAEAAAKARAKADSRGSRSRREAGAKSRAARAESSAKMREAMRTGDERYLPGRDKGPVKRFVRDFVDARFSFMELMIPLLVITMVLGYSGKPALVQISNSLTLGIILLVIVDTFLMRFRLRRELKRRFSDDTSVKGVTYYAVMRGLQPRFLRLPKTQVKIGQQLPDDYR